MACSCGKCDFKTKDGNPRPEYQVPFLQNKIKYQHFKVLYIFLYENVEGRVEAKRLEQELVDEYAKSHNFRMPPEQLRPKAR